MLKSVLSAGFRRDRKQQTEAFHPKRSTRGRNSGEHRTRRASCFENISVLSGVDLSGKETALNVNSRLEEAVIPLRRPPLNNISQTEHPWSDPEGGSQYCGRRN